MQADFKKTDTEAQLEDAALLSYLDSLLREATDPQFIEPVLVKEISTTDSTLEVTTLRSDIPVISVEAMLDAPPNISLAAGLFHSAERIEAEQDEWIDGRPSWAKSRFEVLLFEANGVKFAVPLIELGLIHSLDKELNRMAGHPDWIAGILPVNGKSVLIVDTLKAIMPDKAKRSENTKFKYAITIDGTSWGLSCTRLLKAQTMQPDQVKWRVTRGNRRWLIGTVLDHMCSLIDVKTLVQGFDRFNLGRGE